MREESNAFEVLYVGNCAVSILMTKRELFNEIPPHIPFKVLYFIVPLHKVLNQVAIICQLCILNIEQHNRYSRIIKPFTSLGFIFGIFI